ncbi:hypothetical protein GCM10022410_13560 [Amphibacillus indicireducens]|uniref:Uncharacterized protein n=1 Tax=Amphibacillus indicireducens TaxID=1076330 RepID=A0ABP7VK10_9BACI
MRTCILYNGFKGRGTGVLNTVIKSIRYNQQLIMIYMDIEGLITKRWVKALSLSEDSFRAHCYLRKGTRTFKVEGVLALVPVVRDEMAATLV